MSKKAKVPQKPILEPMPPVTALSSARSFWRRNGLFTAIGLFALANVALLAMDAKRIASTAFGMIAFLTVLSIFMAISYGLQYLQVKRRAELEAWSERRWKLWREGF
jgi:hypothetical protein